MDNPEDYFAVHVPSPDGRASSEGAVFRSLKEASSFANSPESKARGFILAFYFHYVVGRKILVSL